MWVLADCKECAFFSILITVPPFVSMILEKIFTLTAGNPENRIEIPEKNPCDMFSIVRFFPESMNSVMKIW